MTFLAIAVGAVLGALLFGRMRLEFIPFGMLIGGLLGYLVAAQAALKRRVRRVETLLESKHLTSPEARPQPEPAAIPEPVAPVPGIVSDSPSVTAQTHPTAEPAPDRSPGLTERLGQWAKDFVTGGNTPVRIGVVVLFFGVAFLLKYAVEHNSLPIELRLIGTVFGALALLYFGWRLRTRRAAYALALQGGAVGILYLTVFAALRLYQLIPAAGALALLVAIAALSAVLAVLQNAKWLAILGAAGGFLAPVLASTGGGDHVMLFGFYALLNAGILAIAWFKAWRELNLTGFAFTFVIGASWGYRFYQSAHFVTVEPFLILFVLFYVAIAVLFAFRQAPQLKGYVDGTLVFGTPLVGFALQTGLARSYEYGLAWSALALAAFYLGLAWALLRRRLSGLRTLVEAFLALGVVFATLAVPLAFDGRWTAAVWSLEGAAILWIGLRQGRLSARAFGLALHFGAALAFLLSAQRPAGALPVLNNFYLGCVLIAFAALFSAWCLNRWRDRVRVFEQTLIPALAIWGFIWWYMAGLYEIERHVSTRYELNSALVFIAASCFAYGWLSRRVRWRLLASAAGILLPAMYVLALVSALSVAHPFQHLGYIAWPAAFLLHYALLRRVESEAPASWLGYGHAAALWLLALLGAWELHWVIDEFVRGSGTWPLVGWALIPALLLLGLAWAPLRTRWPFTPYDTYYRIEGALPLAVFLGLWSVYVSFTSRADPWPLIYLPLLNPLDLAQGVAVLSLVTWFTGLRGLTSELTSDDGKRVFWVALAVIGFIWLSAVVIRSLHHWAAVPFDARAIFHSVLVQAALSIFWSLLALSAMVTATRLKLRPVWLAAAGLLGVVVIKLFVVDLSNTGTLARIVSFIVVGVLLLLVGYVSPVPPHRKTKGSS